MKQFLLHTLGLSGWPLACLLALLPLLESSIFLGFIFPGETSLVLGGALVYYGRVSLAWMLAAGAVATVIGDSIGYVVGRRWGERLMATRPARWIAAHRWERARSRLASGGRAAVMFGRFAPVVRSIMPLLAGTARMPYRRFLPANAAGCVAWAAMSVLLGWAAGAAWERVHWILLAVAVVVGVSLFLFARRKPNRAPRAGEQAL